ncbi:hypothetical protein DEM27_02825 [Metarhizobium album]|uniref:Uncharacterized protein n=1 Tax=Metarhizobium album TaxID=2182425 RepID=A0A2U2DXT2_9HYPH|nr:hypothetical protein [Rhizobium album]PWE58135.1 hypothetical protein DEM27_02825 [Rhizobium album]
MKVLNNGLVTYSRALSLDSLLAPSTQQDDNRGSRSRSSVASITGSDTVPAPALSQALWDLSSQESGDDGDAAGTLTASSNTPSARDALFDELHEWASMTLGEKIRAQFLDDRGLTEDDVAAMPAEEREALEAEIREAILRQNGIEETGNARESSAGL